MFYVYIYYDPRKSPIEPFYVGKGSGDRMYFHLKDNKNSPKTQKIKKIFKSNKEPIIKKVFETNDEEEAYEFEEFLIQEIGTNFYEGLKDGPLCNMKPGGLGNSIDSIRVRDKDFNYFIVNKNDKRLKTGELLPITNGMVSYIDTRIGKTAQVSKEEFDNNDFYRGVNYNRKFSKKWIQNIKKNTPHIHLYKGDKGTTVNEEQLEEYLNNGWEYGKSKIECPYCKQTGGKGNMKRYHFDNCPLKIENYQNKFNFIVCPKCDKRYLKDLKSLSGFSNHVSKCMGYKYSYIKLRKDIEKVLNNL